MSKCWCGVVLAILVIVFAWIDVSWAKYVLTVLGALLVIKGLSGKCCCEEMMNKCCTTEAAQGGEGEAEQGE